MVLILLVECGKENYICHTEGPNKGVIVEMTLPSSSYATVALRELLKMETSSQVSGQNPLCFCSSFSEINLLISFGTFICVYL